MTWNTDIKSAPHGRYEVRQRREGVDVRVFIPQRVILSTKCGKAVMSHYIPEKKRWMMLGEGEQPLAWMPWPEPYPVSARGLSNVSEQSGAVPPPAASDANYESDGPKSRPGDAAASLTQQSSSPRQERPSAQERSSDRSGGQFGDAPKPAQIQRADGGADITMKHEGIQA